MIHSILPVLKMRCTSSLPYPVNETETVSAANLSRKHQVSNCLFRAKGRDCVRTAGGQSQERIALTPRVWVDNSLIRHRGKRLPIGKSSPRPSICTYKTLEILAFSSSFDTGPCLVVRQRTTILPLPYCELPNLTSTNESRRTPVRLSGISVSIF